MPTPWHSLVLLVTLLLSCGGSASDTTGQTPPVPFGAGGSSAGHGGSPGASGAAGGTAAGGTAGDGQASGGQAGGEQAGGGTSATGGAAGAVGAADLTLRPIAPLSTSTVTSQTPTLHWQLPPGSDGAFVELCRDRACTIPIVSWNAPGTSGRPPMALLPGGVFWRLTASTGGVKSGAVSPVWQFNVGHGSAPVDTSWGTTLDINGDGYADLAVGASGANTRTGGAYIYLGSAAGLAPSPSFTLFNPKMDSGVDTWFGSSVMSAGDINGDGYADLIVNAPGPNFGFIAVYPGGAAGPDSAPLTLLQTPYGAAVASAGDVNGDGYADLLVGITVDNVEKGAAYVFLGSPTGVAASPAATLHGMNQNVYFGESVASIGDINGDGFADFVVGSAGVDGARNAAYVYLGSANALSTTPSLILESPLLSMKVMGGYDILVASAGDFNGDGYADLIIGTAAFGDIDDDDDAGAADVYLGGASGLASSPAVTFLASDTGGLGTWFGGSVACSGDLNGDGFDDLVLGAANNTYDTGVAYVYLGSAANLEAVPALALNDTNPSNNGWFGACVAGTGDVNGDGLADVAVGAPCSQPQTCVSGAAYVFLGSATKLSASPSFTVNDPTSNTYDRFGTSVGSSANVLNPGYSDLDLSVCSSYGSNFAAPSVPETNLPRHPVRLAHLPVCLQGKPVGLRPPSGPVRVPLPTGLSLTDRNPPFPVGFSPSGPERPSIEARWMALPDWNAHPPDSGPRSAHGRQGIPVCWGPKPVRNASVPDRKLEARVDLTAQPVANV